MGPVARRTRWSPSTGIGGRDPVERVVGLPWIQWSPSRGIDGRLAPDSAIRYLKAPLEVDHFLFTAAAKDLVEKHVLVNYRFQDDTAIVSERVPFVSFPSEWSNAQLADAAALTLDLAKRAFMEGVELKDASAWNVIFDGLRPVFCDHLSFRKIGGRNWWAFAQFVRHFLFPLALGRYRGLNAYLIFKIARDGLDPAHARMLFGWRRFMTPWWPFMIEKAVDEQMVRQRVENNDGPLRHPNLFALLDWLLGRLRPKVRRPSLWSSYTEERAHYPANSLKIKQEVIGAWLNRIKPSWVIDYGCNTGEFSKLAASVGARVVALDLDHDCIEKLYVDSRGRTEIFPVIADLDDLSGGRGWVGQEFSGLMPRLEAIADTSMMLAIVHHLAISASIPLQRIAELAHRTSKRWAVVELIDEKDPLVRHLCAQRDRHPSEFSLEAQREAFLQKFDLVEEVGIDSIGRHLLLLKARAE